MTVTGKMVLGGSVGDSRKLDPGSASSGGEGLGGSGPAASRPNLWGGRAPGGPSPLLSQPYTADRHHVADLSEIVEWLNDPVMAEDVYDLALGYQRMLDEKLRSHERWEKAMAQVEKEERELRLAIAARKEEINLQWEAEKEKLGNDYRMWADNFPAIKRRRLAMEEEKARKEEAVKKEEEDTRVLRMPPPTRWGPNQMRREDQAKKPPTETKQEEDSEGLMSSLEAVRKAKKSLKVEAKEETKEDKGNEVGVGQAVVKKEGERVKKKVFWPESRKVHFQGPGKSEEFWTTQSEWTRGKESQYFRKWDCLKMFVGPKDDESKRSAVTLKIIGIPQDKSRKDIFENLEVMSGTIGEIQALYIRLVNEEDTFTCYDGQGFVHIRSPEAAMVMVGHEGIDLGTRTLRCDTSYWEFDIEGAARELDKGLYGFGGPRFSFSGNRRPFVESEGEWDLPPFEWKQNEEHKDNPFWMRYLKPATEKVDWKLAGGIPVDSSEEGVEEDMGDDGPNPFRATRRISSRGARSKQVKITPNKIGVDRHGPMRM